MSKRARAKEDEYGQDADEENNFKKSNYDNIYVEKACWVF